MLYKNVCFCLDRNRYDGRGWTDEASSKRFEDEIVGLFQSDGWEWINADECKKYGGCPEVKKGCQELYLHPMSASGIVIAEDVPRIERLLGGAITFRHYHTDIYEDYVLMTDEEYLRLLEGRRDEIVKDVLEKFQTKRKNLYFALAYELLGRVCKKYRIKRVGAKSQYNDLEAQFIFEIFKELLAKGLIVSAKTKHGEGYRTAKKDEASLKSA